MYTARHIAPGGLGALPALLVTAIVTMVDYKMSKAQIQSRLAAEYAEMKRLSEAQITELSILLSRRTATPEWEWFNLLRSARDMALFENGAPGNGVPANGVQQQSSMTIMWIGLGAVALLLLVVLRR